MSINLYIWWLDDIFYETAMFSWSICMWRGTSHVQVFVHHYNNLLVYARSTFVFCLSTLFHLYPTSMCCGGTMGADPCVHCSKNSWQIVVFWVIDSSRVNGVCIRLHRFWKLIISLLLAHDLNFYHRGFRFVILLL
jgi:hypothetical protein